MNVFVKGLIYKIIGVAIINIDFMKLLWQQQELHAWSWENQVSMELILSCCALVIYQLLILTCFHLSPGYSPE